jgi:type II secretory pathway pseudopilin PulG
MLVMAVGGVVLAACRPGAMTRQEIAVQEQNLQARVQAWARAFNNRQRDSLATYYDQAAGLSVAWPDGDRRNGWDEEAAKQEEFLTMARQVNLVLQDPRVEILSSTAAVVTFRHAMDVIIGDVHPERRYFTGQGTMVWTRADDRSPWVIHAGQVSETPQQVSEGTARRP